jgi:colicin import membrane protein
MLKLDWTISALAHALLLAWGLVSFSIRPLEAPPEGLPVDIISAKDFSEVMAGVKKAPPAPKPRPLVEKVAEKKPVEDPTPKISEKPEIKEAKLEQPTPEPRPKPPEPKPAEAKPQPKPPEPKPRLAEAKPEPKVDQIAEALKKAEAKKREEERKERQKAEQEKKKLEQHRFDAAKIAALLDKRDPQRHQATGDVLNQTAALGLPSALSARLSQSEIDALRARLGQLWNPPAGARNPEELVVRIRVRLTRDGRLAGPPQVITSGSSILFMTARESAVRALFRGQPFDMLRPEHYDQWKDIEITFDPRDMMRG